MFKHFEVLYYFREMLIYHCHTISWIYEPPPLSHEPIHFKEPRKTLQFLLLLFVLSKNNQQPPCFTCALERLHQWYVLVHQSGVPI